MWYLIYDAFKKSIFTSRLKNVEQMRQFIVIIFMCLLGLPAISQNKDLSSYNYVVVPDNFEFLGGEDKYQLNSMAMFYFDKSGFNAYLASKTPNANRCSGLFADVEKLSSFLSTKLQIVLRDCNGKEVYRSEEGRSKFKEFDKAYQDALRKTFASIELLGVKQNEVELFNESSTFGSVESTATKSESISHTKSQVSNVSGMMIPTSKFSNYKNNGKSFLLRKTDEGYSLYEENPNSQDGLKLVGKIVVMDTTVKYIESSGKAFEAAFDKSGNLTIKHSESISTYQLVD